MIYRASDHGFRAKDFHSKCDNHSPTLTIVQVKNSEFLFGGYTEAAWESKTNGFWKTDPKAFIFSLKNAANTSCKLKTNYPPKSIFCHSDLGPTFGNFDIKIYLNSKENSTSDLGKTYQLPLILTGHAQAFLAGSQNFILSELEVFIKH